MIFNTENYVQFTKNPDGVALCFISDNIGSTPRENGAWILINQSGKTLGTIGGGALEYGIIEEVLRLDWTKDFKYRSEVVLGPEIGQCCGGRVIVDILRLNHERRENFLLENKKKEKAFPTVYIFGAGNVGTCLAAQLKSLPIEVYIFDSRQPYIDNFEVAITKKFTLIPEVEIRSAEPNSAYLITTHDHGLDFLICQEILLRGDALYVGMIGSRTKKGVLMKWLRDQGIRNSYNVKIPMGKSLYESRDKRPAIIAAHIVAELLYELEHKRPSQPKNFGKDRYDSKR